MQANADWKWKQLTADSSGSGRQLLNLFARDACALIVVRKFQVVRVLGVSFSFLLKVCLIFYIKPHLPKFRYHMNVRLIKR